MYTVWIAAAAILIAAGAVAAVVLYARRLTGRYAALRDELIARHVAEVRSIYAEMRGWRHDYRGHIQTMKAFRALGQTEQLDAYLDTLDTDLTRVDTLLKSGNATVDAVLNAKLTLAKSRQITVNAKAIVPEQLNINAVDICVLLGNLLDNAMEACLKLPDAGSRFLRVYVDMKKSNLYIFVTNSAPGRPRRQNGRYVSGKPGFHGLGLLREDRIVNKYGGYIKRRDEEGAFTAEVLLPV
jgi:sensor histidine kinase regulating citrate/malate metabolism